MRLLFLFLTSAALATPPVDFRSFLQACVLKKFSEGGFPACDLGHIQGKVIDSYRACNMEVVARGKASEIMALATQLPTLSPEIDKKLSDLASTSCPGKIVTIKERGISGSIVSK